MWLLGINVGHNGATALFHDDELVFYIEEDRLSRLKYDGNPFAGMLMAYDYTDKIDYLIICGTRNAFGMVPWTGEDAYTCFIRKMQPGHQVETVKLGDDHHLTHAYTAFYNSGFEEAAALVIDGAGSGCRVSQELMHQTWEVESIWKMAYPAAHQCMYKNYGTNLVDSFSIQEEDFPIEISDMHGLTKSYEAVTQFLGFHAIEAGKTMGLAPYGKPNPDIKINEGRFSNRSFIKPNYPAGNYVRCDLDPELSKLNGDISWHNDPDLVGEYRKDIAYAVQKSTEERVFELIRKTIDLTGMKKIVIAGGYGLNCVANYEYLKEFPDVDFYNEPIAHDGGNVIGACLYIYRLVSETSNIKPLKTLYLGPDRSKDYDDIDTEGFDVKDSDAAEVAKLIADGNIVCLFQGRSEAGPRALGNRSILYDPSVLNGKDIVNIVKKREWFRPFAGSCLAEKASEWFDLRTKLETPFMMYAVDVLPEKRDIIPAITHVDGTCRVQTVNREQNPHYYDLISEFDKIKGIPILFNTSFNLAGDPLVEKLKEATQTLLKSDLKYLWLPEIGKLLIKKES